ncbi:MAG: hypothetical protein H5T41_02180 [Methanomassiliicoccales archaeon]|nr:hypothetical protein [Methanomassiliicoccales archaeon]
MISLSISNFTFRIEEEQSDYLQKHTENAHHVLLKTTVDLSGFEESELARNKSLSIAHISAYFLMNGLEENDSRMIYFKSITLYLLDRLLPACLGYQWSVKCGNYSLVVSSDSIDDMKTSKFASFIEVSANGGSNLVSFYLFTWMRK